MSDRFLSFKMSNENMQLFLQFVNASCKINTS